VHLECYNEDKHVPEVKPYIRTIKECTGCAIANFPF
jgi:hypothetical protein